MLRRRLIILILWLLPVCGAVAQRGKAAVMSLNESSDGHITLAFTLGEWGVFDDEDGFSVLRAEGLFSGAGVPGSPDLPTLGTILRMPHGSSLTISDIQGEDGASETVIESDRQLRPVAGAWVKDADFPGFFPDKEIYSADRWFRGGDVVELMMLGTMGDDDIYRLTISPIAYNPVRGSLSVCNALRATLRVGIASRRPNPLGLPPRYMIVAPVSFAEGLQPFVDWKRREGFAVTVVYTDTNSRETVKPLIDAEWVSDGQTPDYLLIVGDAEQIQPYSGTTYPAGLGNHVTDLYYVEHTGDYLPDALVGRWPVSDTAALRAVVEKTLRYEQCIAMDTAALKRLLLVAGKENTTPAPTTTNGQVNYVSGLFSSMFPGLDTVCYHNPSSDTLRTDILNDIAEGVALVNYTAHCTANGWSHPGVTFESVDTLDSDLPLFYINNCCLSNAFNGNCFGERLLRKPLGGGAAVVGATNSTLWNEDYYWSVGPKYPFSLQPERDTLHPGAFDMWAAAIHGNSRALEATAGAIMAAGNMAVSAFGSPYDKFYWEIYNLLGDPSLRPYIGVPQNLFLSVWDSIDVGATEVRVSGTPGATVSVVQGDRLLAVTTLDEHRSRLVPFYLPVADSLPVIFTATKAQSVPVADTAWPVLPLWPALSFEALTVGDTSLDVTLVNLGEDTIFSVAVTLAPISEADSSDTVHACFTATSLDIDTLLPYQHLPLNLTIDIVRWAPTWRGILSAIQLDGLATPCMLNVAHLLSDTPPELSFLLLDADSSAATLLEPGTPYILQTQADGICDSIAVTVTALPTGDTLLSPFLTPDTLTHLHIEGKAARGRYSRRYDRWMVAGGRNDSFEDGMASYPWNRGTMRPWVLDSTVSHSGGFSMRSAAIDWRQTSDLLLDVFLPEEDSIVFWLKVSSEYNADFLIFSIDGQQSGRWSGGVDWRRRACAIPAGRHTLRWRYVKDDSGSTGSDCAWIDDVRLPMALWDSAYGWFGTIADTTEPTGMQPAENEEVRLYPNPTDGMLSIDNGEPAEVEITDIVGRRIMKLEPCSSITVDLRHVPAGVYIVTTRRNGEEHHTKLTKL